jgi:transposase
LAAFADLSAPEALELLRKAPEPAAAARLTRAQVSAALKRALRRDIDTKVEAIMAALRSEQLAQPPVVAAAYAATVQSLAVLIGTFNTQIAALEEQVRACFGRTRDAEIYLSQPGLGPILAARVLGEFGDDPARYASSKARKNYAGTSPITRQSGKKKVVLARFIRNDRLTTPLHQQALSALTASPGARAYYDRLRARNIGHHAALRQLANRLAGILHGCLKTRRPYDEHTAWAHHHQNHQQAA